MHHDYDTVQPAFIFCTQGGKKQNESLAALTPSGIHKNYFIDGYIIAGIWAQFPHCNLNPAADRRSFVVYLDHRVLCKSFVAMDP